MVLQPTRPNPLGSTGSGVSRPIWKDRESSASVPPMSVSGDGSDGNVTITGTTTLTRDMYYNNLTIDSGGILQPDGYAIHVRRLLTNNGTIRHNGNTGSNAPAQTTGGSGASALSTNHYGGGTAGGAGASAPGGTGATGSAANPAKGGVGGAGGSSGGAGGTITAPAASQSGFRVPPNNITLIDKTGTEVLGGSGGGGGDDNANPDQAGGGGGSGAGVLGIFATVLVNAGTIQANGGTGGNCWNAASDQSFAGGGGGGGGGWVILVYSKLADTGTISAPGGTGGIGSRSAGQDDGAVGSVGEILKVQL